MKPDQDPVVQNLNEWINRSAGQHQRRISEGTESARRITRGVSECGFDHCSGDAACNAFTCPDHPKLHRIDTSQMGVRDGASVGACRTDLPLQYSDEEFDRESWEDFQAVTARIILLVLSAGFVLGCVLYFSIF